MIKVFTANRYLRYSSYYLGQAYGGRRQGLGQKDFFFFFLFSLPYIAISF